VHEYNLDFHELNLQIQFLNLKPLAESYPYLWKLSKDYDLPFLKKDLETEFANLVHENLHYVESHVDVNSNFISHEDFKYLLVCYLDLTLLPVHKNPDILTVHEEHYLILKNWLKKHPDFIDEWFETFRFITALL
jgi:hypothetical protein